MDELADKLSEHRAFIESEGTLSERRRRNLLSEVLAIATYRMRRELEESVREDEEVRELLDRVVVARAGSRERGGHHPRAREGQGLNGH